MPSHPFQLIPLQDLAVPPQHRLQTIPQPSFAGYPAIRSPVVHGTNLLDCMWSHFAQSNTVFTSYVDPSDQVLRQRAITTKSVHLQKIFWVRLDTCNRRQYSSRGGPLDPVMWHAEDMKGMLRWFRHFFKCPLDHGEADGMWRMVLDNSPWWDCPLYDHIRYVDPRSPDLEREFLRVWRVRGVTMPVRRLRNGDVVCREGYDAWVQEVGEGAAQDWFTEANIAI